jgi:hypothetical protein
MNELTPDEQGMLVDAIHDSATVIHKGRRMNERIKELAIEAGYDWAWDTQIDFGHKEMEKFAELIVRECAKVCNDLDIDDWGDKSFDDGTYYCSRAIKQHFGVEE